jgi:hypothetical protein
MWANVIIWSACFIIGVFLEGRYKIIRRLLNKEKKNLKPIDELSTQDIEYMRVESETEAVISNTTPEHEFVPDEYPLTTLAGVISNKNMGLRKIPIAIKVIYCILWHLERRISVLEEPKIKE